MNSNSILSIIIVSYNTRDILYDCLSSIYKSEHDINYNVWVVDNNSSDLSAKMIKSYFPQVFLIENQSNMGFATANNQAIRQIQSDFVLLLNPDTIVFDHVFDNTINFLKDNSDVGMVTCKLIQRDGSIDLSCRRRFPSLFDGFSRAVGLSKLFPKSPLFARYNLTFLDENKLAEVDAINGAFMMVRSEAIDAVGLLDEDYFMYGEDLDWCFRFRKHGWKIYYLPSSKIIHLAGASANKKSTKMIRTFFNAMEIFCKKNYFDNNNAIKNKLTLVGIKLWLLMTLTRNAMRKTKRVTP